MRSLVIIWFLAVVSFPVLAAGPTISVGTVLVQMDGSLLITDKNSSRTVITSTDPTLGLSLLEFGEIIKRCQSVQLDASGGGPYVPIPGVSEYDGIYGMTCSIK
jgi:hypothetical protein